MPLGGRIRRVVNDPKGTAYDAFQGFPLAEYPVSGKTGTAQVVMNKAGDLSDTSLFVGMVTVKGHQYVVVSLIEQAGRGATISAPIVPAGHRVARRACASRRSPTATTGSD